ncbi:MAG: hypothetical protein GPJ54_03255 [Candidatus Heimdallarchaeota archaeon]|nr:hypothetical protein [Candidatus Heimdallarchaeota archaeon]
MLQIEENKSLLFSDKIHDFLHRPIRNIAAISVSLLEIINHGEIIDITDTTSDFSNTRQLMVRQESSILHCYNRMFPYFFEDVSSHFHRNTILTKWTGSHLDRLRMTTSNRQSVDDDWVYTSNHLNSHINGFEGNYLRVIRRHLKSVRELAELFNTNKSFHQAEYLTNLLYPVDKLLKFFFCTTSRTIKTKLDSSGNTLKSNFFKTNYDIISSKFDKSHFKKLGKKYFQSLVDFNILRRVMYRKKLIGYKVTTQGKLFINKINDYYRYLVDLVHTIFVNEKISIDVFNSTLDENLFILGNMDILPQHADIENFDKLKFFCSEHKTLCFGIDTYYKHYTRIHRGIRCTDHNTVFRLNRKFKAHYLTEHLQIDIIPYTTQKILSILEKLDPILSFSRLEKELILRKINELNSVFHPSSKKFMRSVYKVFIAILFLQVENPEMRKSRHLDLQSLNKIFDHCGARTYNLKSLKKYLRSINFDWTVLQYSFEEAYAYYSPLILNDEMIQQRIEKNNINPDSYSQLVGEMYIWLISALSKHELLRLKASMMQFVLKCIQTFSEIIDRNLLYDSQKISSMRIDRKDIITIIASNLSQYPNISKVYLTRILSEIKSKRLEEYIHSIEKEFIKLIQDKSIEQIENIMIKKKVNFMQTE